MKHIMFSKSVNPNPFNSYTCTNDKEGNFIYSCRCKSYTYLSKKDRDYEASLAHTVEGYIIHTMWSYNKKNKYGLKEIFYLSIYTKDEE